MNEDSRYTLPFAERPGGVAVSGRACLARRDEEVCRRAGDRVETRPPPSRWTHSTPIMRKRRRTAIGQTPYILNISVGHGTARVLIEANPARQLVAPAGSNGSRRGRNEAAEAASSVTFGSMTVTSSNRVNEIHNCVQRDKDGARGSSHAAKLPLTAKVIEAKRREPQEIARAEREGQASIFNRQACKKGGSQSNSCLGTSIRADAIEASAANRES